MPKKTESWDPLRFFNIHSVAKHEKNEKNCYFREKILQCRKTERGFSTSILSQNMKKLKKTKIFIFGKKSHNAEKN